MLCKIQLQCNMPNLKDRDDFIFKETLSELPLEPKTEEDIKKQLFKGFDPDKVIDEYEAQLGVKAAPIPTPNIKYKHIMLSPAIDDNDSECLTKLMNDPELYQIINRDRYWTPRGELKIWIEYTENLDVKKQRESAKTEKENVNE